MVDGGESEGKEGAWTGTGKEGRKAGRQEGRKARLDWSLEVLQSVRKEQPAGGNGDFWADFLAARMVARADWLLETGTLAVFETSADCGAV